MLYIVYRDGDIKKYKENEYTDYHYYGKVFVVIKGKQWIGIYNMEDVRCIEVRFENGD